MAKKIPQRSCIGCREPRDKNELLRIVRTPEAKIVIDISGKQSGRGAYICKGQKCLKDALSGTKLAKALKVRPEEIDKEKLTEEIKSAFK